METVTGLVAALLALDALGAVAIGAWTLRLLKREEAFGRSLHAQFVCAAGFGGGFLLLLAGFELSVISLFGVPLDSMAVAWIPIQSVCLLVMEAQIVVVWRARPTWGFGWALSVMSVLVMTLTANGDVFGFSLLIFAAQAIVLISAIALEVVSFLRIGARA